MFNSYCTCLYRFSLDLNNIYTAHNYIKLLHEQNVYVVTGCILEFLKVTLLTTVSNFKINRLHMFEKITIFNCFIVTLLAIKFNFIMYRLYMLMKTTFWKIPFHIMCQKCNAIKHLSHITSVPKIQCN